MLLLCLTLMLTGISAMAQPTDVPQGHWAYDAVSSLAEKGLVLGYPDGKFLGNRTMTRYEMATIICRVLENIKEQPGPERLAPIAPAAVAQTGVPKVTREDLAAVAKLVSEFKMELTVIGADLKSFNDRLVKVEGALDTLNATVNSPDGKVQATISDVKKLKQVKVSGFVQARYEYDQSTREDATGANVKNGFQVRRARVKVAGSPTANTNVVIQVDAGGNDDAKSVVTKDAYLGYYLKGSPALGGTLTMGQFNWPFGYQLVQSEASRETPERARVIRALFPGERDRGIKFSAATDKKWLLEAGLFNGTGANTVDNNNDKDVVGRFRYTLSHRLDMGLSLYSGKAGATEAGRTTKSRYGADFQYSMAKTSLKAEYITAKDLGFTKMGYWAQIVQNLTNKDAFVAMYDFFKDAGNVKNGNLTTWDLGLIHSLDSATKVKLFYEINKEEKDEFRNDITRFEIISLF